jgi:hypothetical protein
MPTKRYSRWRKVVVVRQRKLRKLVEDQDDEMMAIATGGPPKEQGK